MNTVYLIGNGFDINLGLRTRYSDFYDYYLTKPAKGKVLEKFKKHLSVEIASTDKWSDLELSLGEYLQQVSSVDEFDVLIDNILDELAEYLKNVQLEFKSTQEQNLNNLRANLLKHLFMPENYIDSRDRAKLFDFYKKFSSNANLFSLINFNYTSSFETILGLEDESNEHWHINQKLIIRGKEHVLKSLFHVHGSVNTDMVLGVNDNTQIHNENFQKDADVTNQIIKPECNLVLRHGLDLACEKLIDEADVICIFGSSLGVTDEVWWELIASHLREKDIRLVIFEYNPTIRKLNATRGERRRNELIDRIFASSAPENIKDKVYVKFNSDIFSL
jgi:hypothetical protein